MNFLEEGPVSENKIFSPTEINQILAQILEESFDSRLKIKGEITNLSRSSLGHVYFSLKDVDGGMIGAVCWKGFLSNQKNHKNFIEFFKEGSEIVCTGKLSSYYGKIQISAAHIEFLKNDGVLFLEFEKTKKKLAELGFFDASKKKPLPSFPRKVCLITSKNGAVIQDMLSRIKARFPIHTFLINTPVQGKSSIKKIVNAINFANKKQKEFEFDLLILARGGGSFEELSIFNDEEIVKAIFFSQIPIISAIGHETDFTLSDFASDLRAQTPSSAIEICLKVRGDVENEILNLFSKIHKNIHHRLKIIQNHLRILSKNFSKEIFLMKTQKYKIQITSLFQKIEISVIQKKNFVFSKFKNLESQFEKFDHKETLKRGYILCWQKEFMKEKGVFQSHLVKTNKDFGEILKNRHEKNLYFEFFDGHSGLI
jgi:exodeoxyribonuclease VII large subunit